jgi:DNA-binding NtrC family response regulator
VNVLIVDDEVVQIECLRRGVMTKGFGVIEAINAEEALRHLDVQGNRIGLVLTDYAMPGMNGIELLKTIRIQHATLPIILMTAYSDKRGVIDSLCNPRNGFLLKPFTLVELLREIEKVSGYRALNPYSPLRIYD